jgi:hypothetical protein
MNGINKPVKLYITLTSPYARLARIVVLEKELGDKVEQIIAKADKLTALITRLIRLVVCPALFCPTAHD